mmetsp:Transcript_13252/g.34749  ORF Transcript_13252/g.34749 Transcript_13252/m.34749 type:complete len:88 (-) Transcript_13252:325-588(-)
MLHDWRRKEEVLSATIPVFLSNSLVYLSTSQTSTHHQSCTIHRSPLSLFAFVLSCYHVALHFFTSRIPARSPQPTALQRTAIQKVLD